MTAPRFLRLADVDVHGKRVFIRSDLNVPQDDDGRITDDTRIRASLPAIKDSLARGGAVMVTSHLGRPTEGTLTDADSLAPIRTASPERCHLIRALRATAGAAKIRRAPRISICRLGAGGCFTRREAGG